MPSSLSSRGLMRQLAQCQWSISRLSAARYDAKLTSCAVSAVFRSTGVSPRPSNSTRGFTTSTPTSISFSLAESQSRGRSRSRSREVTKLIRTGTRSPLLPQIPRRFCSHQARLARNLKMDDRDVLPDNVKPRHYNLSLRDLEFKNWTYKGTVTIDSEIVKPTKEVVVNTLELKLSSAKVTVNDKSLESANISYDEKAQRATIVFDEELPVADKAAITIEFEGVMNNEMAGFYRSKYKPVATPAPSVPHDDEWHYMLSTQFEACDARRAFPCFDEPNLKATFDFDIEIPDDQLALSNMPVKETRPSKDGWQVVSFETSPVMSTYLLAWAFGDFEYIEAFTDRQYNGKQIPVRVYTTRGLKDQGQWALQHAPKIIDFFSEIFDIDYPLPKSDLIAVHEFTHGAMENWGLVTYRTTQVLYDEKSSDPRFKNSVAYVVAHELAHQWFGNLVTMDWWDELWLNEGFATWVGWHAVDHLHPDWQVWAQFVNEGMESAFRLDGIRASHPIHVPVRDALDINQIFDSISYLKGCSAIRMLANHLGVETFLKGVSNYLKAHAYGNAKTTALWQALSEASGKDVPKLMDPWISKIGHPVVTVAEEPGQISIKQSRFLSTGDVKPEDDTTTWWVPLGLEGKKGQAGISSLSLTSKEDTIRDIDDDFYKLNSGATGFYRVNYPPERLAKLSNQLDKLSTEDKISIIGSTGDLAFAGNGTTPALLTFLQGFGQETHTLVWRQVLDSIAQVKSVFGEDENIKKGLDDFTLKLINDKVQQIGWDFPENEDYLTGILRKELIGTAVACGHTEICEEAFKRFNAWVEDAEANPLPPPLRVAIWRAAINKEPARTVEILKKEWFTTKSVDGKLFSLSVLGLVKDEELLLKEIIPFNFNQSPPSNAVPSGDMHVLGGSVSANIIGRPLQWKFMKENWDAVIAKLGNPVVVDRYINTSLSRFTNLEAIDDIQAFMKDKDTKSFDRTLGTVIDKIRGRAAYRERDTAVLKEWLGAHGYL
ncbi:peptidase family M1-domain-containing protein [Thelonectria olida]|uniref:Aminopeptidase n=1 Tax=Thelonectria olida TaxID=1576542 RepID=A0A9P8VZJ5_9HYPO|nr:peptidase family M1-domain-containing protein [Thelonectria olida]